MFIVHAYIKPSCKGLDDGTQKGQHWNTSDLFFPTMHCPSSILTTCDKVYQVMLKPPSNHILIPRFSRSLKLSIATAISAAHYYSKWWHSYFPLNIAQKGLGAKQVMHWYRLKMTKLWSKVFTPTRKAVALLLAICLYITILIISWIKRKLNIVALIWS